MDQYKIITWKTIFLKQHKEYFSDPNHEGAGRDKGVSLQVDCWIWTRLEQLDFPQFNMALR